MKIVYCKVNQKNKKSWKGSFMSLERVLFIFFIVSFVIMIIAQASFMNPTADASLHVGGQLEGSLLGQQEDLFKEGTIILQLLSKENDERLKVLVNGDESACFEENKVELNVKDGDIIEIDGSAMQEEAEVSVVSTSENISTGDSKMRITVQSNIKRLLKVKID